jgi:hypothetical protein
MRNIKNNALSIFGFTEKSIAKTQKEFRSSLEETANSRMVDSNTKQQLLVANKLSMTKEKLLANSKNLGEAERRALESQIMIYEAAA